MTNKSCAAYPDGCTRGETVFDPGSGDVIVQVPPLSEEKLQSSLAGEEEYLVDDGWKAVEVHANGIGPSVELVMGGNGHAANGKGLRIPTGDFGKCAPAFIIRYDFMLNESRDW